MNRSTRNLLICTMKKLLIVSAFFFVSCLSAAAQSWSEVGPLSNPFNSQINVLATDHLGNVYAAGHFYNPNTGYEYVAKWNGTQWTELGVGTNALKPNYFITTLATDLSGNVYAAGNFYNTANNLCYVSKWNGTNWTKLGEASLNARNTINMIGLDANQNVYAAGRFRDANDKSYVSKWDGTSWTVLGNATTPLNGNGDILSMAVTPDGTVYVAGEFKNASGDYYVAKWDGNNWTELDGTVKSYNGTAELRELAVDASGNVYAAGFSTSQDRGYIAKWNGTEWTEPGGANVLDVHSIETVAIDPSGNLLVSSFKRNSGNGVELVHKWDGIEWTTLGTGAGALPSNKYFVLSLVTDPSGNIYAAGEFTNANDKNIVVKWNPDGVITGIQDATDRIVRLYPNPAVDQFTVDAPEAGYVMGYNSLGVQVLDLEVNAGANTFSGLTMLSSGLYTLVYHTEQGSSISMKLWKE